MNQQKPNKEEYLLKLLKKIADSTATDKERAAFLKKLNAAVSEFSYSVADLKSAIEKEN